jgi:DNA-binding transcriptional regulator YdaS (Cro superfamily)
MKGWHPLTSIALVACSLARLAQCGSGVTMKARGKRARIKRHTEGTVAHWRHRPRPWRSSAAS